MSEVKEEAGGRKEGADTALKTKTHTSMWGKKALREYLGDSDSIENDARKQPQRQ